MLESLQRISLNLGGSSDVLCSWKLTCEQVVPFHDILAVLVHWSYYADLGVSIFLHERVKA